MFKKLRQGYSAELGVSFTLKDGETGQPVFLKNISSTIHVEKFAETVDSKRLVRVVENTEVPAAAYTAIVSVRDRTANNLARAAKSFIAEDFYDRFTLTGPLLSMDSLCSFAAKKLLPKDKNHFAEDIFALLVFGGLQENRPLKVE
ncbi:MAG: hypothetical protein ACE5I1_15265 [bacterium]